MKPIYIYVLLAVATLTGCNSRRAEPSWKEPFGVDTLDFAQRRALQDSLFRAHDSIMEERMRSSAQPDSPAAPRRDNIPGSPPSAEPRASVATPESHQMRGFDPPSEDDMEDNGLSRFMENNDEEGWN